MQTSSARRSEPRFRALIIGCGKIAGRDDQNRKGQPPVTHAASYAAHPGFELVACVEPDDVRRGEFLRSWNVEYGFTDLSAFAASGLSVDVASVCAPSEDHGPLLRQLLGIPVKLVFCEKPLTRDLGEGRAVAIEYERAGRLLAVNYTRRWNPSLARLRSEIVEERWGQLITAAGFYTKGVLNNGSHLIDLLRFLVGDLGVVTATARRADWSREEPTVDAVLRTADGAPVHLMGGDARAFHMFELTLVFERGVIALENGGRVLRVRRPAMSNRSPGQIELGVPSTSETEWGEQFLHALDNIHDALTQGVPLASSAKEALAAQAICAELAHCAGSACWVGA